MELVYAVPVGDVLENETVVGSWDGKLVVLPDVELLDVVLLVGDIHNRRGFGSGGTDLHVQHLRRLVKALAPFDGHTVQVKVLWVEGHLE